MVKRGLGCLLLDELSWKGFSGLYTTPDPERFCVIARGYGYFVTADQPERWDGVAVNPITDVRPSFARGIIVFADYTQLCWRRRWSSMENQLSCLGRAQDHRDHEHVDYR